MSIVCQSCEGHRERERERKDARLFSPLLSSLDPFSSFFSLFSILCVCILWWAIFLLCIEKSQKWVW